MEGKLFKQLRKATESEINININKGFGLHREDFLIGTIKC